MKIEMISRSTATHKYRVVLEGDEVNWSDGRIITHVDRRGCLTDAEWDRIERGEDHTCVPPMGGIWNSTAPRSSRSGWASTPWVSSSISQIAGGSS